MAQEADVIRVYTHTEFVKQYLTLPKVKFVDHLEAADIVWSSQDFSDWDKLKPHQKVNQLPNESCLTFKHNYAKLVQQVYGAPSWMPATYNLTDQLSEFVGHYLKSTTAENEQEQEQEEARYWITKPWNYARGLEISVSKSLPELVRQHDSPTPKIVQKYLTRPCLYNDKKFDLRYIVLVRRIQPTMVALVYNMFWIRLANKKFNLQDLDDYERQFTVMNYSNYQMTQLDHKSFIRNIEKMHHIKWNSVQADINKAIKGKRKRFKSVAKRTRHSSSITILDVLVAAASQPQPLGLLSEDNKQPEFDAFSIYGFDVMLSDDYKPVIIEVNFSPDCTRACQVEPN